MKNHIVTIFFVILFIFSRIDAQKNFFMDDWAPKEIVFPTDYVQVPAVQADTFITVNIDFSDTLAKVSPYLLGHNVNTFFGVYYNNPELLENIRNLNCNVLRYPGGSGSNIFFWDRDKSDGIPSDANITKVKYGVSSNPDYLSLENFYRLRDSLNLTSVFVVNYSYARYGTSENPVGKAAHYAADWVRYDNGRTKFWEIGNENYGAWEEGYEIDTSKNQDGQPQFQTGELYGKHFKVFVDSMKNAAEEIGSDIKIGAIGYKNSGKWNNEVMKEVGNIADFIIVHKYFARRSDDDRNYILQTAFEAGEPKKNVTDALIKNGFAPLPVALTEWNISSQGSLQKVSFVNGMHAVLTLGQLIKEQYGFATRWNLVWRYKDGNTHGLIGADRDNKTEGVKPFEPRAPFYYFYYFQKYFGDIMVNSFYTDNDITSYASLFANNGAGIVLVNKSNYPKYVKINPENYVLGKRYYWYVLTGGNDNGDFSRCVVINGFKTDAAAGGPENYYNIKPYSSTTDSNNVKILLPPYSVLFMLLEEEEQTSVKNESGFSPEKFKLYPNYPNPFNPSTTIVYELKKNSFVSLKIYDSLGRNISTLVNGKARVGKYRIVWDGKDMNGSKVSSGSYFVRLNVNNKSRIIKLMLIK